MQSWQRDLQFLAVGVAAAVAAELLAGATPADATAGNRGRSIRRAGRLLLAGGTAAAYAHLVPTSSWGLRSGIAFAQLPLVASAQVRLGGVPPLQVVLWGAVTGLLSRSLQPLLR